MNLAGDHPTTRNALMWSEKWCELKRFMTLTRIGEQQPVQCFQTHEATIVYPLHYLERYRNEGTRTYSKHAAYTEAESRYRPDGENESFLVRVYGVPVDEVLVYTANPQETLAKKYLGDETVLFCVHPQVVEQFADDPCLRHVREYGIERPGIAVVPSSSTRTLFVTEQRAHALKLHFPFRVSRYGRKMRDEVIEQAINVSLDLEEGINNFDERFAYLREVIGVACINRDDASLRGENWGYLVRDMEPYPPTQGKISLVPGFALYGSDFFQPDATPLLYELIGSADPVLWVLDNLMLPVVRHWVQCFTSFGYMLEPHGQNTLLEVAETDTGIEVKRIVHRDLSLGIDMRLRKERGLSSDHLNQYNQMDSGEFASITYDMFMGSHFFDRIVACCQEKYPHILVEDFREPCRETFVALFPGAHSYIPATVHYFSEKRDQFNKPLYKDTGRKPVWRP